MGILSCLTITATGALAQDSAQLKKWTEANGGKWVPRVQRGVTHLIASKDSWKKRSDAVQEAIDIGAYVVSYDWLEDSLQRKRKLAEKKYTWEYLRNVGKKRKELKRMGGILDAKKFNEGCEMAKEGTGSGTLRSRSKPKPSKSFFFGTQGTSFTPSIPSTPFMPSVTALERRRKEREVAASVGTPKQTSSPSTVRSSKSKPEASPPASILQEAKPPSLKDLYHYYLDSTGFEYKITVVRSNFYLNNFARYQICILESHTKPHVYCTLATYKPPAVAPHTPVTAGQAIKHALLTYNTTLESASPNLQILQTPREGSHPEAARLLSLTTPPVPSATSAYKSLICPLNSTFPAAFLAFRTAFRDLTLLRWEERFDNDHTLQKARAKELNVEPFAYARPALGMPDGRRPQAEYLDQEGEYVRNGFKLPGLDVPLGKEGAIGRAVERDEEERRKVEEMAKRRAEVGEVGGTYAKGGINRIKEKKPNFNKPLFNCATGKPQTDAWGNPCPGQQGVGGGLFRRESSAKNEYWGYEE